MLVVVTYDISDDKRRNKLFKTLKNYGYSVQYSVFECFLNNKDLSQLKKEVLPLINQNEDSITYYSFCESCINKISAIRKTALPCRKATIVV